MDEESPACMKNVYLTYKCDCLNTNEKLDWTYSDYIFTADKCKRCGMNYNTDNKSVIRWQCSNCSEFYCTTCFPVVRQKQCPGGHFIEVRSNRVHDSNDAVCDLCGKVITGTCDDYFDYACNLLFCEDCKPIN